MNFLLRKNQKMLALEDITPVTTVVMVPLKKTCKPFLANTFQALRVVGKCIDLTEGSSRSINEKIPPHLNIPDQILSMRYHGTLRGIKRSKSVKCFAHSIIMDVGTKKVPISLKFSSTIEITGTKTIKEAVDSAKTVVSIINECQESLKDILTMISEGHIEKAEEAKKNYVIHNLTDRPYDIGIQIVDYILSKKELLFEGVLEIDDTKIETVMVNYQFRLLSGVNIMKISEIMNSDPFVCSYNPLSKPYAKVYYNYLKMMKDGKEKKRSHTLRIGQSGSVMFSGPSIEKMVPVYNAFVKRYLEYKETVRVDGVMKQKYQRSSGIVDNEIILKEEMKYRKYNSDLLSGKLRCVKKGEQDSVSSQKPVGEKPKASLPVKIKDEQIPQHSFSYSPISL